MSKEYGTQEELDAARDDATLLPWGKWFKCVDCVEDGDGETVLGMIVTRHHEGAFSDEHSVAVVTIDYDTLADVEHKGGLWDYVKTQWLAVVPESERES